MARYPAIFDYGNARKNSKRKNMKENFHVSTRKASLSYIKKTDLFRSKKIMEELPVDSMPFELLDNGDLVYSKIIYGTREEKYWIFRIDARNGFNQFILKEIPDIEMFSLEYLYTVSYSRITSHNYYIIYSEKELFNFIENFSNFIFNIDFSVDQ